jgi:tetratricopeptide (TPR) repeat protein
MSIQRVTTGLLLAVAFSLSSTQTTYAQDQSTLLEQGMIAFHNGDFEQAKSKFREIVASDPSNADALLLLHESEDALLELLIAGGEFETFAKEMLAAARDEGRSVMRDLEAAEAAAAACFSDSYEERAKAIFSLHQTYGPFAAVPLVHALGDAKESRRLASVYALSRMGSNVVIPLLSAAYSANTEVRLGALHVLNVLNDPRASGVISDLAANDSEGAVRALASGMVQSSSSAGAQLVSQAWSFFNQDANLGLSSIENHGVLFAIDGRNLTPYEVPQSLVAAELAKNMMLRAGELGEDVHWGLALIYASEVAMLKGIDGAEDHAVAQRNALLTLPHQAINHALKFAVGNNKFAAAHELISVLDGSGGQSWDGLREAMGSGVPMISHSAAVVLAHRGEDDAAVISNLGEAVALESKRLVHIIDGNSSRASTLATSLEASGVSVMIANDGASGLVNMHLASDVDAFVVADVLPDLYASRVIKNINMDPRFNGISIFEVEEGAQVSAEEVIAGFSDLSSARQAYENMAAAAAAALAHCAFTAPDLVGDVSNSLVIALNREDSIAISAAMALGNSTCSETEVAEMVRVLSDSARSSAVRVACANALSACYTNCGIAVDASYFQSAMTEGDAALTEACSRAIGTMGSGHISAGVSL